MLYIWVICFWYHLWQKQYPENINTSFRTCQISPFWAKKICTNKLRANMRQVSTFKFNKRWVHSYCHRLFHNNWYLDKSCNPPRRCQFTNQDKKSRKNMMFPSPHASYLERKLRFVAEALRFCPLLQILHQTHCFPASQDLVHQNKNV